jgi:4,5-dihydroxyphthalate decarboxylase
MPDALQLSVACGDYDRTRPLFDGRVAIEGCRPVFLPLEPEEIFFRALRYEEFDVTEHSFSGYVIRRARGDSPYVGIPVFISRVFRHSAIYVRTDRNIVAPQDLRGRVLGVPEWQQSAGIWARGMLQDEYGVAPRDIRWVQGGMEMPGRTEKIPFAPPGGISLKPITEGKTLSGMLEAGEIDGLIAPRVPSCLRRGAQNVGRLFPNFGPVEEEYYRRTGIFPIMHIIAVRKTLVDRHPWLPSSVFKAFLAAKELAVARLSDPNALSTSLPALTWTAERAKALMGGDPWSYGIEANTKTIEVFLRYHHEQGLSPRQVALEELFPPSTTSQFRI